MNCECLTSRKKRCKLVGRYKVNSYGVFINSCRYHTNSNPIYEWSYRVNQEAPKRIINFLNFYNGLLSFYDLNKWLAVMITAELFEDTTYKNSFEKLFELFEEKVYKSSKSFSECSICLSDDPSDGITTRCGHNFCRPCISRWIKTKPNCPLCRELISCWKIKKHED